MLFLGASFTGMAGPAKHTLAQSPCRIARKRDHMPRTMTMTLSSPPITSRNYAAFGVGRVLPPKRVKKPCAERRAATIPDLFPLDILRP